MRIGIHHDWRHSTSEPLQTYAREHFGLEALADDWDKMLRALHAEVTERVVPVFTEIPERRAAQHEARSRLRCLVAHLPR